MCCFFSRKSSRLNSCAIPLLLSCSSLFPLLLKLSSSTCTLFLSLFSCYSTSFRFSNQFLCYTFSFYLKNCITRCIFLCSSLLEINFLSFIWYCCCCCFSVYLCVHYIRWGNGTAAENDAVHNIRDGFFFLFCVLLFDDVFFNGKICENFSSHDANLRRKQKLIESRKKCNHL